jgi:hypothetical protein
MMFEYIISHFHRLVNEFILRTWSSERSHCTRRLSHPTLQVLQGSFFLLASRPIQTQDETRMRHNPIPPHTRMLINHWLRLR